MLDYKCQRIFGYLNSIQIFEYDSRIRIFTFLAHLSRRLIGELVVYPCVGVRLASVDLLLRKITGPINAKFYVEPPCVAATKLFWVHLGHVTKMAATPWEAAYMVKYFKKFFFRTSGPISTKLGMLYWGLKPIKACLNDDPGLTLTNIMRTFQTMPSWLLLLLTNFVTLSKSMCHSCDYYS